MRNLSKKQADATALIVYFTLVFLSSVVFDIGRVTSTFLVFVFPSLYLVVRYWRIHRHVFLFSLVAGLATGVPFQIMAELNNVWKYDIVFDSIRIGNTPLDAVAWWILWVGFTVTAYRVFFDKRPESREHHFWRNHEESILLTGTIVATSCFLLITYPAFFVIPHPYVVYGSLFALLPTVIILLIHPQLWKETIKAATFFTLFTFIYEIIGLHAGWWTYPGEYIWTLNLLGALVPVEEFVLWILFGSLAVVTIFEEFEMHEHRLARRTV